MYTLISMFFMQQQLAFPTVVQCNSLVITSTEHDSLMHPALCLAANVVNSLGSTVQEPCHTICLDSAIPYGRVRAEEGSGHRDCSVFPLCSFPTLSLPTCRTDLMQ